MIKRYDVWRVLLAGTQPVDSYDVGEAVTQPATHPYLLFRTLDRERAEIRETVRPPWRAASGWRSWRIGWGPSPAYP